jgi:hypothetical protein
MPHRGCRRSYAVNSRIREPQYLAPRPQDPSNLRRMRPALANFAPRQSISVTTGSRYERASAPLGAAIPTPAGASSTENKVRSAKSVVPCKSYLGRPQRHCPQPLRYAARGRGPRQSDWSGNEHTTRTRGRKTVGFSPQLIGQPDRKRLSNKELSPSRRTISFNLSVSGRVD